VPFRSGTRDATLFEVDANNIETGAVAFTTRDHESWASAARRALDKADRAGWEVIHRALIERRIASDAA
jgi:hypothetical protein